MYNYVFPWKQDTWFVKHIPETISRTTKTNTKARFLLTRVKFHTKTNFRRKI